ncbi:hypothetical protein GCM10023165_28090 [Variovorax defluvii]|uniref:Uncharacterized protein n=1 Tax=Variovorax defluvii TaxID=913761 RepID=A0ABP8HUF8_9BURK
MPRQSEHRTQFLKLAEEFFYASAVPPHDPDDPDADDLAVAFELEGIQFELTHRGAANDPINGLVFVHTVASTLPEEPRQAESMLREALLATREGQRRTEAGLNRAMHGNLGLSDHAPFMTDSGEDDGISDSGDEDNLYVDVVVDSEEGASDVDDDAWLDEDDASDESTTDEIVSDPDTEEGLPIEN